MDVDRLESDLYSGKPAELEEVERTSVVCPPLRGLPNSGETGRQRCRARRANENESECGIQ